MFNWIGNGRENDSVCFSGSLLEKADVRYEILSG